MQALVIRILSSETQRPSLVQLWQMPEEAADPTPPLLLVRELPLEEQETSYFAPSASILSLSIKSLATEKSPEKINWISVYHNPAPGYVSMKASMAMYMPIVIEYTWLHRHSPSCKTIKKTKVLYLTAS
jgi:hypothetical protein